MRKISISYNYKPLPEAVRGISAQNKEDSYIILLNESLTEDQQTAAFLHECLHIYHRDHDSKKNIDKLEKERHTELKRLICLLEAEA